MKRKHAILLTAIIAVMIAGAIAAFADTADPGSSSDPLVSKSYVDAKATYKAVMLNAGQTLIGDEGTELIVRSGEFTAIDNGANGVSDITSGKDLMTGAQVGLNHLLLVPKNDGRGISARTEGWIMVRGNYTIK